MSMTVSDDSRLSDLLQRPEIRQRSYLRRLCLRITLSRWFLWFSTSVIIANTIVLCINW